MADGVVREAVYVLRVSGDGFDVHVESDDIDLRVSLARMGLHYSYQRMVLDTGAVFSVTETPMGAPVSRRDKIPLRSTNETDYEALRKGLHCAALESLGVSSVLPGGISITVRDETVYAESGG